MFSVPGSATAGDWSKLIDRGASGVDAVASDGTLTQFVGPNGGPYALSADDADSALLLTTAAGSFTLKDQTSGDVTTFTRPTGGGPSTVYAPTLVASADGATQRNSYSWRLVDGAWTPTPDRAAAPNGPGVTADCTVAFVTTATPGCRQLQFVYDGAGRLVQVKYWAAGVNGDVVKQYYYDVTSGRLLKAWDPRLDPGAHAAAGSPPPAGAFGIEYAYDTVANGYRLLTVYPAGRFGDAQRELPWTIGYTALASDPTSVKGRVGQVSRPQLAADGSNSQVGTATTVLQYQVPLTAPYDLTPVAAVPPVTWNQTELPVTGTAVVPPGHSVPVDLNWATITYVNDAGLVTNVAEPGGNISTTQHDASGRTTRELTPANRATALAQTGIEQATADKLETDITYGPPASDGVVDVSEILGPAHLARTSAGDEEVRASTRYTYDTLPNGSPAAGGPYHQVTMQQVGAWAVAATQYRDVRVTLTEYDWVLLEPTATTIADPVNGDVRSETSYNVQGQIAETRMPKWQTAHDDRFATVQTYYSASSGTPACPASAAMAGLLCESGPKAALSASPPAGRPNLPATRISSYDAYARPLTIEQYTAPYSTSPPSLILRSTTVTYDPVGREATRSVSVAPGLGGAVPQTTNSFSPITGRLVATTSSAGTIAQAFDVLGRRVSYTDAAGVVTATTYDARDRFVTTYDGKGTTTFGYDAGSEKRGLLTSVADSSMTAPFTAVYDADGRIVDEVLPNGLHACSVIDPAAMITSLEYRLGTCGAGTKWLAFSQRASSSGQVATSEARIGSAGALASSQAFAFDDVGRLTQVLDSSATACTTRTYTFDADTNRTSVLTRGPTAACDTTSSGTPVTTSFDQGDRVADPGFTYDALGRTTAAPAGVAGPTTMAYFANDMIQQLGAAAGSTSFTLDPAGRINGESSSGQQLSNHYGDDGDAPTWTASSTGHWTRLISDIAGALGAVQADSGVPTLQLADIAGSVVATVPSSGAGSTTPPSSITQMSEYGQPEAGSASQRYGWLGAQRRQTEATSQVVLMGRRVYSPSLGRFLSVDPVQGGSANAYEYCVADPISCRDLDGTTHTTHGWFPPRLTVYFSRGETRRARNTASACAILSNVLSLVPGINLAARLTGAVCAGVALYAANVYEDGNCLKVDMYPSGFPPFVHAIPRSYTPHTKKRGKWCR